MFFSFVDIKLKLNKVVLLARQNQRREEEPERHDMREKLAKDDDAQADRTHQGQLWHTRNHLLELELQMPRASRLRRAAVDICNPCRHNKLSVK